MGSGSRVSGARPAFTNAGPGGRVFRELVQIDGSPHDWFEGAGPALHTVGIHR